MSTSASTGGTATGEEDDIQDLPRPGSSAASPDAPGPSPAAPPPPAVPTSPASPAHAAVAGLPAPGTPGHPDHPDHPDARRRLHLRHRGLEGLVRPADDHLAEHGLDEAAVAERVEHGLTNRQPRDTSRSIWKILRVHVLTLFNLAIGSCAAAIIVLGRWFDLVFCFAALANVVIGVVQEYSAKRKLDQIALLHQDAARVLRSGTEREVRLEDIVLDDAVVLRRGDQVPADGVVLAADGLDIDESLLTGESDAVGKLPGHAVLSGSAVLSGHGLFRVSAVGADSHASQLAIEARRFSRIHSELRGALDTVAKWLTIALVPIVAVIVNGQVQAIGGWAHALATGAMEPAVVASVAAITSMVPQGLALMTTIAFAVAALKLARDQVLIQEQPAVEILARVDTVCLDKTGTLTEGRIVFDAATPLAPAAAVHDAGEAVLAWFGADANANPTALALRERYAAVPGAEPSARVPFASARRWSAVAFGTPAGPDAAPAGPSAPGPEAAGTDGAVSGAEDPGAPGALHGAWVLGAPEALLDGSRRPGEHLERIRSLCHETTEQGLRTMLLCRSAEPAAAGAWFGTDGGAAGALAADGPAPGDGAGPASGPADGTNAAWAGAPVRTGELLPPALEPVALLTFREKVRDDAHETLEYFRAQGVELKIISGDNPRTVAAVAREVGMTLHGDGYDARHLPEDDAERRRVLDTYSVFGRVTPDQKKGMVKDLQDAGHVVAMTGDGINDALALKSADLGIAMGNGAPATKAVSRMVLLDSRFSRLPSVLAEGRQVIANIEQLAHLYLTKTSYAVLFGVVFSLLAWQYPLLPRQASTVDFLMIGLPTFFLALAPNQRRYVPGFLRRSLRFALPSGLVILTGLLAVNLAARWFAGDVSVRQVQTASVITLTLMGLWVLNLISRPLTRWKLTLIASMYALLVVVLVVPASQRFHQFEYPPLDLGLTAGGIGVVGCVLLELIHLRHRSWVRRTQGAGRPEVPAGPARAGGMTGRGPARQSVVEWQGPRPDRAPEDRLPAAAPTAPRTVDVLVIGGGNAGISLAARLHRQGLRDVAVVEPKDTHHYRPMLSYVGAGLKTVRDLSRPQARAMPDGVTWVRDAVAALDTAARTAVLASGTRIGYRDVVVCPGSTPDWDAVPGSAEAMASGFASTNYTVDLAPRTWELIRGLRAGRALFTIPDGPAPTPQIGQKILYLACDYWQRRGVLRDIEVTLLTPTATVFGQPDVDRRLEPWVSRYGIRVVTGARVRSIDAGARRLAAEVEGTPREFGYDLLHHGPVHRAPSWIAAAGLGTEDGYVDVDPETLRHRSVPSVWACGDAAELRTGRSGGGLRHQTRILADNLLAAREGRTLEGRYDGYTVTPVTVARGRALFPEYDRDNALDPSIPGLPLLRPSRALWFFDLEVLPREYWYSILKGR
nr:HAD-IC family P-type ATPase [Citricoccus sp. SGAir0253]